MASSVTTEGAVVRPAELQLTINGQICRLDTGPSVPSTTTLATLLREHLGLTGVKIPCDRAHAEPARSSWMAKQSFPAWS